MSGEPFHFGIETVEIQVLSDGALNLPAENLFANAPPEAIGDLIDQGELPGETLELTMSPLLIRSQGSVILVDAGFGAGAETSGRLTDWLQRAGLEARDVNMVLLSHAHADHVGGLTDAAGAVSFPEAEVVVSKAEWDHWRPDVEAEDESPFTRMSRRILGELEGRVRLIEDGDQVMPDVRVRLVPGHTPGHLLVEIGGADERILLLNDLVLHPLHLAHPEWYAGADYDGPQNVEARRAVLAEVEGRLCHVYHFPYPAVGRVRRGDRNWIWEAEPSESST